MPKDPSSTRPLRGFATGPGVSGSKYTLEETIRLQEMFLPQSDLYRRRRKHAMTAFVVGGLPLIGSLLLNGISNFLLDRTPIPQSFAAPIGYLCLLSLAIGMGLMWSLPALKCPACHSFLNQGISRFCPECGSDHLDTDMFGRPLCKSCGMTVKGKRNEARSYRIRACTGCGVMLDYQGL